MLHCSCLRHNEITAVRPNECPQLPGGELLKFAAILHFSFSFKTETREFNISFLEKMFPGQPHRNVESKVEHLQKGIFHLDFILFTVDIKYNNTENADQ